VLESVDADEPLSEFRAAWSPAEQPEAVEEQPFVAEEVPAEVPFVAERPATPFMAEAPVAGEPADAWFVADVLEPVAKQEDPSPSKTDTWSGRALGS
jgi:hypothetical protein